MPIIRDLFLKKVMFPRLEHVKRVEDDLAKRSDQIQPIKDAPVRFNHPERAVQRVLDGQMDLKGMFTPKQAPLLLSSILGVLHANASIQDNPENPRVKITPDEIDELTAYARDLNCLIGFAKLDHLYIFKDKSISFDNSIVLAMEMDAAAISTSPSYQSSLEVQRIYKVLGDAGNKIAKWLRNKGFACHAVPPRNGLTLHPPMAVKAGIGYFGLHGLCISKEYGPRVRVSAVHTNITNLPFYQGNDHKWIADYCDKCRLCIKHCPANAFYDPPIHKENGIVTHIDQEKCFPFFAENHGCAVCIAVCPFSKEDYGMLKNSTVREHQR
jgi:NAD-dependent dihydropyrimidine dehydrogenase PreA subunit